MRHAHDRSHPPRLYLDVQEKTVESTVHRTNVFDDRREILPLQFAQMIDARLNRPPDLNRIEIAREPRRSLKTALFRESVNQHVEQRAELLRIVAAQLK